MHSLEEFKKARDAAMLSLDEEQIRAMVRKFNNKELPAEKALFWAGVHKAITGNTALAFSLFRMTSIPVA